MMLPLMLKKVLRYLFIIITGATLSTFFSMIWKLESKF